MKAVVLAAGEGQRLRPLTYTRPKCMIPLAGKPILEHVLESVKSSGIREAVIVVKYMSDVVRAYFGEGKKIGMKLSYVEQGNKYGTAAALACVEKEIDDSFLAIAGDIITESASIKKVLSAHEKTMTMGLKKVWDVKEYGIATLENRRVTQFVEKPAASKSRLANMSTYAFEPSVFKDLRKIKPSPRGEYELTDLIKGLISKREVDGVEVSGYWLDMGMPWHLFDANDFLLGKEKEKKGLVENSTVKGKLVMAKGAEIIDSYIEGPVYIGENTVIGPHAYIRGTTSIGNNCEIGDSTTIKNSIILDNVNAKHLAYIGDSIIGANCNFGAGSQIANFRFDEGTIKAMVKGKQVETKRKKLGVMIGDNVKTGVLSAMMPGKTIGDNCWIGASVLVTKDIPRNSKVFVQQKLKIIKD